MYQLNFQSNWLVLEYCFIIINNSSNGFTAFFLSLLIFLVILIYYNHLYNYYNKFDCEKNLFYFTVTLPENLKGYKKYDMVYITNDEIKETIPATIEDGYLVFETSHLSQYGVIATEQTTNTNIENPKTSDNIIIYFIIGILSLTSLIVLKKKFNF